jgi:hypothetical protein
MSLTSTLAGVKRAASSSSHFTSSERIPGTQWIHSCLDPAASLHMVKRRANHLPEFEPWASTWLPDTLLIQMLQPIIILIKFPKNGLS